PPDIRERLRHLGLDRRGFGLAAGGVLERAGGLVVALLAEREEAAEYQALENDPERDDQHRLVEERDVGRELEHGSRNLFPDFAPEARGLPIELGRPRNGGPGELCSRQRGAGEEA